MQRWRRYWFAPTSGYALAIVRIAVATSILLALVRLGAGPGDVDVAARARLYHPVGVLCLLGGAPPPAWALDLLRAIGWAGALALLVGARARIALVVAFVPTLLLAAHAESFTPTWSHSLNAPLLAAIALLGAHTSDAWSIDAWLRVRRGLPAPPARAVAPARRAMLAVGLMFVSAAAIKIASAGFTLDWAFSDNLRHQILARFDMQGDAHTRAADWLLAAPWRWQAAALFNLACQLAPLVAILFVRHPRVRAACALLFVVEVMALGIVMDLWNPQWLPLFALFVDWDWLLRTRPSAEPIAASRGARAFTAAFVAIELAASFGPSAFTQGLGTFPFSNFPMFSKVLAAPPYDRHQAYVTLGQELELTGDRPLSRADQDRLAGDVVYRRFFHLRDPGALRDALGVVIADAHVRFPDNAIRGARLWLVEITVPPFPAPAHLELRRVAVLAELEPSGFRTALGAPSRDHVTAAGATLTITTIAGRPFFVSD